MSSQSGQPYTSASNTPPMLDRYLHDSSLTDRLVTQANSPQASSHPSMLYNIDGLSKELTRLSTNYTSANGGGGAPR